MNYKLFTTSTCPKCPEFKAFVAENVKFEGEILDEKTPNFMDQAQNYGITKAPAFLVFEGEKEIFRTSETYDLDDFLKGV